MGRKDDWEYASQSCRQWKCMVFNEYTKYERFFHVLHRVIWKKWDTDTALKPIPKMLMCV